ncbi:unnamed protein product, partial [Prunus brigantina]
NLKLPSPPPFQPHPTSHWLTSSTQQPLSLSSPKPNPDTHTVTYSAKTSPSLAPCSERTLSFPAQLIDPNPSSTPKNTNSN